MLKELIALYQNRLLILIIFQHRLVVHKDINSLGNDLIVKYSMCLKISYMVILSIEVLINRRR